MTDQVIGTEVNRPVSVSFYDDLARNWVVLNICCICSCLGLKIAPLSLFLSPLLPSASLHTSLKKRTLKLFEPKFILITLESCDWGGKVFGKGRLPRVRTQTQRLPQDCAPHTCSLAPPPPLTPGGEGSWSWVIPSSLPR